MVNSVASRRPATAVSASYMEQELREVPKSMGENVRRWVLTGKSRGTSGKIMENRGNHGKAGENHGILTVGGKSRGTSWKMNQHR